MRIEFDTYTAEIQDDSIAIFLGDRRYTVLKAASALDGMDARDTDQGLPAPEISRDKDGVDAVWRTTSSLWEQKTYRWRFEPELFWCEVTVKGRNRVKELRYFDGGSSNVFGWSFFDFSQFFTPECALLDQRYYKSIQYGCIDASTGRMGEPAVDPLAECHWIFSPPPLCYCLGFSEGPWLAAGLAPKQGQYGFSRYEYITGPNSYCLRLAYDGMTEIDGEWTSPRFVFMPAADEYTALGKYCDQVRAWGIVNENKHPQADWWSKPMFCGWGEQGVLAVRHGGGSSQEYARQDVYDGFLDIMREKRLKPGVITIDDKWQKHYGTCQADTERWPDLRGRIDARHAEGVRVLLWYGAWNSEGLTDEEKMIDPEGRPSSSDPSAPAYQARIKEFVHRMLSPEPGCYNADGIKDHWTNIPVGPGWKTHSGVWGIELAKLLCQQMYDAAKAAKPDSLFVTQTANPYFSECTDMLRLNDIYVGCREIVSMMTHRAKIARVACPHALIDTDNSSSPDHTEWLAYTRMQPELGVPSLYFLTGFSGTLEEITDEDWDILAPIWRG